MRTIFLRLVFALVQFSKLFQNQMSRWKTASSKIITVSLLLSVKVPQWGGRLCCIVTGLRGSETAVMDPAHGVTVGIKILQHVRAPSNTDGVLFPIRGLQCFSSPSRNQTSRYRLIVSISASQSERILLNFRSDLLPCLTVHCSRRSHQ
jgi:hypothetical protein